MKVTSFLYDASYAPSAPIAQITISANTEIEVNVLVDSGADVTLIPINLLQAIGARQMKTRQLRGVTGIAKRVGLHLVSIRLSTHIIRSVYVVAGDKNTEAILGRDVLNHLVVTLDGPAGVTEIRLN